MKDNNQEQNPQEITLRGRDQGPAFTHQLAKDLLERPDVPLLVYVGTDPEKPDRFRATGFSVSYSRDTSEGEGEDTPESPFAVVIPQHLQEDFNNTTGSPSPSVPQVAAEDIENLFDPDVMEEIRQVCVEGKDHEIVDKLKAEVFTPGVVAKAKERAGMEAGLDVDFLCFLVHAYHLGVVPRRGNK